jgi:hypothetical protein
MTDIYGDVSGISGDFSFLTKKQRSEGISISEIIALVANKPAKKKKAAK